MLSKKIILSTMIATVAGASLFGVVTVGAQTGGSPAQTLASVIAQEFNLDQNQVQTIINQYRSEQRSNIEQKLQQRYQKRLDQEVKNGKITSSQEQAILAEIAKVKSELNSANLKNMTPSERKQELQQIKSEVESWAKSEGIDPKLIMPWGWRGGPGWKRLLTPTPAPSV